MDEAGIRQRVRERVVAGLTEAAARLLARPAPPPPAAVDGEGDELHAILQRAQRLLLAHPRAAQALFRALVAEGRRYGGTEEGARWRAALLRSDLARRVRVVWEVGTLNALQESDDTLLPSDVLDALVKTASVRDLEPSLFRLFRLGGAP